jgi:hypothetical protein
MAEERPKYSDDEELEDIYGIQKPDLGTRERDVITEKELIVKEVKVPQKQAMPRKEEERESIKRITPELIGGLFERVKFLEERIRDIRETMDDRKDLHKMMIKEIDDDISEKKVVEAKLTDLEDKRNLKLDISMLRRDKRNELVRFWKDMYELRAELKELTERHEVESRVTRIFDELDVKEKK